MDNKQLRAFFFAQDMCQEVRQMYEEKLVEYHNWRERRNYLRSLWRIRAFLSTHRGIAAWYELKDAIVKAATGDTWHGVWLATVTIDGVRIQIKDEHGGRRDEHGARWAFQFRIDDIVINVWDDEVQHNASDLMFNGRWTKNAE